MFVGLQDIQWKSKWLAPWASSICDSVCHQNYPNSSAYVDIIWPSAVHYIGLPDTVFVWCWEIFLVYVTFTARQLVLMSGIHSNFCDFLFVGQSSWKKASIGGNFSWIRSTNVLRIPVEIWWVIISEVRLRWPADWNRWALITVLNVFL